MTAKLKLVNKYREGINYFREYTILFKEGNSIVEIDNVLFAKTNPLSTYWNRYNEWTIVKGATLDGFIEFYMMDDDDLRYAIDTRRIESLIKCDNRKWNKI